MKINAPKTERISVVLQGFFWGAGFRHQFTYFLVTQKNNSIISSRAIQKTHPQKTKKPAKSELDFVIFGERSYPLFARFVPQWNCRNGIAAMELTHRGIESDRRPGVPATRRPGDPALFQPLKGRNLKFQISRRSLPAKNASTTKKPAKSELDFVIFCEISYLNLHGL